jgi:hypothetical protein
VKWVLAILGGLAGIVAAVAIIGAMLPKGHTAARSSHFRKSPHEVWSTITGPPDWRPDVHGFEQLPPRNGRRTWKEIDSHKQAVLYEIVEEAPPTKLVTRIADPSLPYGGTWTYELTPSDDGCVLKITEDGEVYNPIFRFLSRFVFGHSTGIEAYMKALQAKLGEAGN